ncbi:MAG: autotransporter domain-containing protein, partial [Desulfuromonadaceae bacterium]|nr:autotransporter domain-containing protein [Desulfuromonadaceae bacterium]
DDSAQRETEFGMWIRGIGQWGEQDKKDGFIGYDYDTGGLSCGFDWALNPHVLGGFSLGYAYTDIQGEGQTTSGDLKSTYLSAYGTYFTEKGYLESVLSYGLQSYDNWRRIAIGAIDRQAFSSHDGHTFSAFLRGGYNFDRRPWVISPYAALKYINLSEDAFEETGAGAINLTISGRDTDSLSSEIGARFQRVINVSMGALVPELSLAWNYDFAIDDRIITAGFAGSPGTFFPTEAPKIERNSVVVETGISLINRSGFTTHIQYAGTFRKSYRDHSILGELRYEF